MTRAGYEVQRLEAAQRQLEALGLGDARHAGDIQRVLGVASEANLNQIEAFADRIKAVVASARPARKASA